MDLPSDWTLTNVKESERDLLEQLLQFYLYDFSEMDDEEVDEAGRFRYPVTGPYGREPGRHALLLRVRGKPAGFVLVDERSPIPGSEDRRYVREFFVMRAYRRHGYGAAMAWAIFDRFPGRWQVEQIGPNVGAQAFWRRVIGAYTAGRFSERTEEREGLTLVIQEFDTSAKAVTWTERDR